MKTGVLECLVESHIYHVGKLSSKSWLQGSRKKYNGRDLN